MKTAESQPIYDCIIIGAGISGLSFAHHLNKEKQDVLILEKENEYGGQIKTFKSEKSDYWCELGAHTCYNMYSHLLSIVKDLYADDEVLPMRKCSYVMYASGKIRSVFSQLSILSIAIVFGYSTVKKREKPSRNSSNQSWAREITARYFPICSEQLSLRMRTNILPRCS